MRLKKLIIDERIASIGDSSVGRFLPVRQKRQVGPVTFLDHMGPMEMGNGKYLDVDQHPHIGLSTLTYLYEGSVEHRDSLGTVQIVQAGDVGFMTAGKGITHTERTPAILRTGELFKAHGFQIWIALPTDKEEMDPDFEFIPKDDIPSITDNGLAIKIVAGKGFGMESPLQVHSPLFIVDVQAHKNSTLDLKDKLLGEIAIAVDIGGFSTKEEKLTSGQMLITENTEELMLNIDAGSRLLMLGGEPLKEPRYLLWNFVSSSQERLQNAKEDWIEKRFPKVPGDNTYVSFP